MAMVARRSAKAFGFIAKYFANAVTGKSGLWEDRGLDAISEFLAEVAGILPDDMIDDAGNRSVGL